MAACNLFEFKSKWIRIITSVQTQGGFNLETVYLRVRAREKKPELVPVALCFYVAILISADCKRWVAIDLKMSHSFWHLQSDMRSELLTRRANTTMLKDNAEMGVLLMSSLHFQSGNLVSNALRVTVERKMTRKTPQPIQFKQKRGNCNGLMAQRAHQNEVQA